MSDVDLTATAPTSPPFAPVVAADASAVVVTATGSTTPRTLAARAADVVNVKDFGAVGDGVHDDTAAFVAAFAEAAASQSKRRVCAPAGIFKLTSGIGFAHVRGISFQGAGSAATMLRVTGNITGPVLDLNGVNTSEFGGFTICTDVGPTNSASSFDTGIRYWWDLTGGSSYNNTFSDIQIWDGRFKVGIQIGSDLSLNHSGQEDQTRWFACKVAGYQPTAGVWDATWFQEGVRVGSGVHGNNLIHQFFGCNATGFKYGVREAAGECIWTGGCVQSNEIDWYFSATGPASKFWKVSGVRSEVSGRFIGFSGSSSLSPQVSFENCGFYCDPAYVNADRNIIDFQSAGVLRLSNFSVTNGSATYHPRISFSGSCLLMEGATIAGATPDDLFVVSGGYAANNIITRGVHICAWDTGVITDRFTYGSGTRFLNSGEIKWSCGESTPDLSIGRAPYGATYGSFFVNHTKGHQPNGLNGIRWRWGTSTATDGVTNPLGSIIFNTAYTDGGSPGWICTVAGDPGTWVKLPGRSAARADVAAAPTQAEFNDLLAKLRTAGLLAP